MRKSTHIYDEYDEIQRCLNCTKEDCDNCVYYGTQTKEENENKPVKICPFCGSDTKVYDSREDMFGGVIRKRVCVSCGITYKTKEIFLKTIK